MIQPGHASGSANVARQRRRLLTAYGFLLGLALILSLPGAAFAQRGGAELLPSPTVVTLQEAVEIATQRRPGRVVRAVTVDVGGGRRMHEIRILLDEGGRVVTVRVDAQTGRVR
jgi:uncharacterized membrane protein YkoI